MVIKVYISGISGSKEVKKRQQRVLLILDSKNIKYEVIDIAEPGAEESKDFMQSKSTAKGATISDPDPRHPLPPQLYNDDVYCGDYDMFDMANEVDEMEKFLKLESADATKEETSTAEIQLKNGGITTDDKTSESKEEEEPKEKEVPEDQDEATNEDSKDESKEDTGAGDEQIKNGKEEEVAEEKQEEEVIKESSPQKADD